jgi:Protein of unknown function (DUF3108)
LKAIAYSGPRIPWRGLAWAVALSLLAHALTLMAMNDAFQFNFKGTVSQASLSTRMIETPIVIDPSAANSKPVNAGPARPRPPAAPAPKPPKSQESPAQTAATPFDSSRAVNPQNDEEKQASPPAKSTEFATNTIAETVVEALTETVAVVTATLPNASDTTATATASAELPAAGVPAALQQKLAYPGSVKMQFEGIHLRKGVSRSGVAEFAWRTDGVEYEIQLVSTLLGLTILQQTSSGRLSSPGLMPERYSDKRINKSEQAAHFRREQGKIQFSNNKPEANLMPGAQDRLSALLQLAGILGGNPEPYLGGQRIQMQVVGTDSAEQWEFLPSGVSELSMPAGKIKALRLLRKPRDEFDQRLEIWLATEMNFLPVRMRQSSATTPEQDYADLVLRKLP